MKKVILLLCLSLALSAGELGVLISPWGDRIELLLVDLWTGLRGKIDAPKDVVLLSMDERSFAFHDIPAGQPWPRRLHAQMLRRMKELGAKRVVMDILFLGPSADRAADAELAEAMRGIPTVLGADTGFGDASSGQSKYGLEKLLRPYEPFEDAAEAIALPKMPVGDGFIREFILPRSHITAGIPTLYEAAVGVKHEEAGIPSGRDILWYYGPPGTIPTYPYYQIFESEHPLPAETFKDKIVFVGLNLRTGVGPMEKDSFRVPFREREMFGVEIQATAAANVLTGKWIHRFDATTENLFLFFLTFLFSFIVCIPRPHWGFGCLVASIGAWTVASYTAFLNGVFIPGAVFVSVLPFAYLVSTVAYYFITYRSQQAVEKAFRLYLPREMAKEMSKNTRSLELGGESVEATALFTDIAGFTQMAEEMSAPEVSQMLNAYFTDVIKVIFAKKGTVIKFIGDAIFVIWGAPIKAEDHAQRAAEAALAVAKEVDRFNATKRFPPLHTRIGVNTGTMVVGNLGSTERFDYTAIGDSVNLAARLEGLNKYFGTRILISDSTQKALKGDLTTVSLGKIRAAGKRKSIEVFTVVDELGADVEKWRAALASFESRNWAEAEHRFKTFVEEGLALNKAASLYLEELSQWKSTPPPPEWNGEVTFTSK